MYVQGPRESADSIEIGPLDPALKRILVDESARGSCLGRRMLAELELLAVERGFEVLQLKTNRSLTDAISLYRSASYREVPRFNDEPLRASLVREATGS